MNKSTYYFALFIIAMTMLSCQSKEGSAFMVKPTALGIMNDIVIVSDQDVWDGPLGDSLDYLFGGAYPITPSPEPIFDLKHYTPLELEDQPLRKELRTYMVVANLSNENSSTTKLVKADLKESGLAKVKSDPNFRTSIGKDKWAYGQIVIYLFANSDEELVKVMNDNYSAISNRINNHDSEQLYQSTYSRGENKGISRKVEAVIGTDIEIPFTYQIAKEVPDENMIWVRTDTKDVTINIVFRKFSYTSETELSKANMKAIRDEFGKKHISSAEEDSYMKINDEDLPILEYNNDINGIYTKEYRGIWEMENDFMGGPFITYMMANGKDLIYVDGFVWAPGKEKRDYLQQIQMIFSTINKNPS